MAFGATPIRRKHGLHHQKRFFADNLHHKSQVAIFGTNLKNASVNNAKGEHLFFDNNYQSEYQQCYDELAKKSIDEYLRRQKLSQEQAQQNYAQRQAEEQAHIYNEMTKNFVPSANSHLARQEFLKGQWKMEDMDPESNFTRDILLRQQEL